MKAHHLIALLLWRGGLLLAGGTAAVLSVRFVLLFIDISDQILAGLSCLVGGFVLLLASVVAERLVEARAERELP